MLFSYKSLSQEGKKTFAIVEASSIEEAKKNLYKQGIAVLSIKPYKSFEKKISLGELLLFIQQLSKLLKASLPLYEALLTLEEKNRGTNLRPILLDLCSQIKNGIPLSKALASYPKSFSLLTQAIIKNGEKSGSLEKSLDEISLIFEKKQKLQKLLLSTFLYPAILIFFCFIVLTSLFFFIIPSLFELFDGKTLPPLTCFVFTISRFMTNHTTSFIFLFFATLFALFSSISIPRIKSKAKELFLKLPLIKPILIETAISRFARALSSLLSSGVSYLEALTLSKEVLNHPSLEKDLEQAIKKVEEGKKLSTLLKTFPSLSIRMLSIAEESGAEPTILKHLASFYEDETEKNFTQFTAIIQPAILLLLGLIVGVVVLSVLLPLTDVSSLIGDF